MSHYEERLEQDLAEIRGQLEGIYARTTQAVRDAVRAVLEHDRELAARTILGDRAINRATRQVDGLCHRFVVRHVPTAVHLRFVSSVMRLTVALERVGDYAVAVCREAIHLQAAPEPVLARDVETLGRESARVLEQSARAFAAGNSELARSTIDLVDDAQETFKRAYRDLVAGAETGGRPVRDVLATHVVLRSLMRVADQAENICEQALFAVNGEAKSRKTFRVLFVDERNEVLSQLACAYASRAFPETGRFSSAGFAPGREVPAAVRRFLEERGHLAGAAQPQRVAPRDAEQRHYHVIVGLEGDPAGRLETVPYLTVALTWDVGPQPDVAAPDAAARLEEAYRQVGHRISELMQLLAGPDAA